MDAPQLSRLDTFRILYCLGGLMLAVLAGIVIAIWQHLRQHRGGSYDTDSTARHRTPR